MLNMSTPRPRPWSPYAPRFVMLILHLLLLQRGSWRNRVRSNGRLSPGPSGRSFANFGTSRIEGGGHHSKAGIAVPLLSSHSCRSRIAELTACTVVHRLPNRYLMVPLHFRFQKTDVYISSCRLNGRQGSWVLGRRGGGCVLLCVVC